MNEKLAKRSLYTLLLVVLLSCAGIALPYPILAPMFLNEVNSFTHFAGIHPKLLLGFLLAIYPLGLLLGSSFIGAASDIYGRRKVLTITLVISAIGYLLSVWALINQNYLLFALTRFITGVSEGNIAIAKAIAIDLSPPLDKTRSYSLVAATTYAGWLLGPLLGGLLQPYGAYLAFMFAAIAMLITVVVVYFFLQESQSKEQLQANRHATKLSLRRVLYQQNSFLLLKDNDIRRLFWVFLFSTLATNAYYEFYPLYLVETYNFNGPGIGYITAIVTTFMILSSVYLIPVLKRKYGMIKASTVSMFAFVVLMFVHLLFTLQYITEIYIWPLYMVIGMSIAIYNALLPIFASEQYANISQGKLMGLITTTFSLSNVIMAIIGSIIAIKGSIYSLLLGGVLMIVAILLLNLTKHKNLKSKQ